MTPQRGEVWLFDLGIAGKVRPAVVVSVNCGDNDRVLTTIVPHSTSLRGSQFEVAVSASYLKPGAFVAQSLSTYPTARAIRRMGVLRPSEFESVVNAVLRWIGCTGASETSLRWKS